MHEDDGDRVDAVAAGLGDFVLDGVEIRHGFNQPVGAHPLVDLDDPLVNLLGQEDFLGKNVGPGLVGDLERVAETLGDQQKDPIALALQQRIGGDRGAHLDFADALRGHRLARRDAQQVADALDGGVAVGLRILRQQLARVQASLGIATDNVGERAAAIDPEIPGRAHLGLHALMDSRIPGRYTANVWVFVNVL
jgi:hypothetical protein